MKEYKFRVYFEDKFYHFTLDQIMERSLTYQGDWDLKALRAEKQQYIGIKDINNKEIYEGDIVRNPSGRLMEVYWFSSSICNCWDLKALNSVGEPNSLWNNLEVVGNVHENMKQSK